VRRLVAALLKPFRQLRSGSVDLTRLPYDTRAAYALYQAIFAPLRSVIGAGVDLVIVPDDVLTFVPFDALIEDAPRPASAGAVLHAELAGERYLLHRHAISYMSSSAQLVAPATGADRQSAAPGRFFAMANPAATRASAPAPGAEDPLTRQLRSGAFGAFLSPVPGAETEVQRIARHFQAGAAVVLTGADATETAYEAQAGRFGVLHFATHAVASDGQPFYSTLVLAPDDAPGRDGFLQAYEVIRMPLRADLVVLSGCETALGAEDLGQGLVGLVAAFQQAGARSVLATLWSIDEATVEVMDRFYGAMAKGASPASALRGAKLAMLKQKLRVGNAEMSLAHPFFWAPFVLVSGQARESLPALPVGKKRGSMGGK
jgi:CHAT domain-containing protein